MALSRPQGMSVSLIGALALATASAQAANNPSYPVSVLNPPGYSDIYATSMTIGPDGNIWVAEGFNKRVGKLSVTINPTTTVANSTYTAFAANPSTSTAGITSGPDGNLWFTELNSNKITRMTTQGVITEFPVRNPQANLGAITSGPDGAVWFIDSPLIGNTSLGRIAADGTVQEFPVAGAHTYIKDLTTGADGNLWFVDGNAFQLYKVSTAGSVLATYTIPSHGDAQLNAAHIILGPDGNVWFPGENSIDRAKLDGTITEYPIPAANGFAAGIAIGADGNIWFSDHRTGEIGYLVLSSATDSGQATIVESNLSPFEIFQADQLFLVPPPPAPASASDYRGAAPTESCPPIGFLVNDTGSESGQNMTVITVVPLPDACADISMSVYFSDRSGPGVFGGFQVANLGRSAATNVFADIYLISDSAPSNVVTKILPGFPEEAGKNVQVTWESLLNSRTIHVHASADSLPLLGEISVYVDLEGVSITSGAVAIAGAFSATPDPKLANNLARAIHTPSAALPSEQSPPAPPPASRGGHH